MRLRDHLLAWLLVPLLTLWVVSFRLTYERSVAHAHAALDRTLLGSALTIAERSTLRDGALLVELPNAALEMLGSTEQDRVYYKVACVDPPLAPTGYEDLPAPTVRPSPGEPRFSDAIYRDAQIRMVSVVRPVFAADVHGPLLIQVAETTAGRRALSRRIMLDAALTQLAMIAAAAVLIAFGVHRGLASLRRVRDEVAARPLDQLTPIGADAVPQEVAPLIEAINTHTERQRELHRAQRQFIADAAHQLKTPLTAVKTQVALALQSRDPEALHAILREIGDGNEATARMVHQLLALARSDSRVEPPAEQVDLVEIARQAAFDLLPPALRKGSEIAFDDDGPLPIRGLPLLLRELVLNLVDNAIRYTPPGAAIEVSVRRHREHAQLVVRDNGPGIDAAERERVFDRFYRLAGSQSDGAGLGLAIVAQIVRMHGATIALAAAQGDGGGLCVRVSFSAVEATQPTAAGAAEGGATPARPPSSPA